MKRYIKGFFIRGVLSWTAAWFMMVPAPAASQEQAAAGSALPFTIHARSGVLMNAVSGQIVYAQSPDLEIPPASLTKLMTLQLALDAVDNGYVALSDSVRISKKAWKTGGSKMFLEVDTEVPLETLLKGIAVVSANDACVAVAEYVAGVEEVFVEKMNKKAAEIGMAHTNFENSHGLPVNGQYTTAQDMAKLAWHYIKAHPEALAMHSTKEMTFNNITQRNRNGLLWLDYGVDGLKTGWFEEAGFHIVVTAGRDSDRFIAAVMGAEGETQRENIALKLLNYGFRNFKTIQVVPAATPLAQVTVWKGREETLAIGAPRAVFITLPREKRGDVLIEKDVPKLIFAPLTKGQDVGELVALVDGTQLKRMPLIALSAVERAGSMKVALHTIILFFAVPPYWGGILVLGALLICIPVLLLRAYIRKKKSTQSLRALE